MQHHCYVLRYFEAVSAVPTAVFQTGFFLLSKFRDVVTVHHTVQIQWVMSEVFSTGLTKTYTLY